MKMYFEHSLLHLLERQSFWRFFVDSNYRTFYRLGKVQDNDILIIEWPYDYEAEKMLMSKILKKTYDESLM